MSTIEASVVSGLLAYLGSFPWSPTLRIANPNTGFTPGDKETYLRATILPASPQPVGQDASNSRIHQGLLQVDVFYPNRDGEVKPAQIVDALADYLDFGTLIPAGDFWVEVSAPPERLTLYADPPWAIIPLRVRWRCIRQPD